MIRAIAAIDDNHGIAAAGNPPWNIPWSIPADVACFKALTAGQTIVMGRLTYQGFSEPLVGRRNVVASHSLPAVRSGFEIVHDTAAFLRHAEGDVWIIGGAALYKSTIADCDELYITHVRGDYNCDRFFPEFNATFTLLEESAVRVQGTYSYTFARYGRPKNR